MAHWWAAGVGLALATAGPVVAQSPPPGITLRQLGHGAALTDAGGMTLYIYLRDPDGASTCAGPCAEMSPPVVAAPDASPVGEWSPITRDDGRRQWAFRGKPLYRSLRDRRPGTTNGEEFAGQWRVAFRPMTAPPGFGAVRTALGHVLTDPSQSTVYARTDTASSPECDRACARTWMPVAAPAMAHAITDWSIIIRDDGLRQWAFRGAPLFRYAPDVRAGDTLGDGVAPGWRAVVLESPPPVPDWVTVRRSDSGDVRADAEGRTLYIFSPPSRLTSPEVATDAPKDWRPVPAVSTAAPVGDWAPVQRPDGLWQWTYRGLAVFTNINDRAPGDILGVRSSDLRFTTITLTGLPMQGIGQ